MKKLLPLFTLALLFAQPLYAQEFGPSQQAQGYLDSKEVSVDHAIGLFHYSVPIYTLKSGGFELPITLDYVAKGVSISDVPGLIGYNWNLNVGGVVTRTMRGGIADELLNGYLSQTFSDVPTPAEIEAVNKREKDGECDIFTAVFGGRSVHFIIAKDDGNIMAEPLERTAVRIECEQSMYLHQPIDGWVVTDENGNKFYFRQKEWSEDVLQEEAISFNGIRGYNYVSSWYLSRIEPRNAWPIVYSYRSDFAGEQPHKYYEYWIKEGRSTKYNYGRPMSGRSSNFPEYEETFNRQVKSGEEYMRQCQNNLSLMRSELYWEMKRHERNMYDIDRFRFFNENDSPLDSISSEYDKAEAKYIREKLYGVNRQMYIVGQPVNFPYLGNSSSGAIRVLEELAKRCESVGDMYATVAAGAFRAAAQTMQACMNKSEVVYGRDVYTGSAVKIRSPLISAISCGEQTIVFDYNDVYKAHALGIGLSGLRVENKKGGNIFTVSIDYGYQNINKISFTGKDNKVFKQIAFKYHDCRGNSYDPWGFSVNMIDDISDGLSAKNGSLSEITVSDGGKIVLDYEPNLAIHNVTWAHNYGGEPVSSEGRSLIYGGIRIKSIALHDNATGSIDSVLYNYPQPGEIVFRDCFNHEFLQYDGFRDELSHREVRTRGNAFINTGNNGVFYRQVEEQLLGKGKTIYSFFVPRRFQQNNDMPYQFWLNGLPLSISTYDTKGALKSRVKNIYNVDGPSSSMLPADKSITYSKSRVQVRAYEHYMDRNYLEGYFRSQGIVHLGPDVRAINPYLEIYEPNILPRTSIVIPREQHWNMLYGGKVLLRAQEKYVAYDDVPFEKTEYFYDNIQNSIEPTRITTTDSKGNTNTSAILRVGDMNVPGVITRMKERNILSPIIKRQNWMNGKLLKETVNVYAALEHNGRTFWGETEEKTYFPTTPTIMSILQGEDNNTYQFGQENYMVEKTVTYSNYAGLYLPTSISEKGCESALLYNHHTGAPMLSVKGYGHESVAVHHTEGIPHPLKPPMQQSMQYMRSIQFFRNAYDCFLHLEQAAVSSACKEFINGTGGQALKAVFYEIHTGFRNLDYDTYSKCLSTVKADYTRLMVDFMEYAMEYLSDDTSRLDKLNELYYTISYYDLSEEEYDLIQIRSSSNTPHTLGKNRNYSIWKAENQLLKLCVFLMPYQTGAVHCEVFHANGLSTISASASVHKPYHNLRIFDVDLSSFKDVRNVSILPDLRIWHACLVPSDCEFVANGYNPDGTVAFTFDQTGRLEWYERDGAGRVIKVVDQNGNTVKENEYYYNVL